MIEVIQYLLFRNNCVVIPNFGAFIGNYNPAEIRLQQQVILPPSKSIAFNRLLSNNDGLLINEVARRFSISYQEAELEVANFVKQCNNSLAEHKSLILKDIGKLIIVEDNNIQFLSYHHKNYLLNSFGLQKLSLAPIQRLKDEEVAQVEYNSQALSATFVSDFAASKSTVSNWAGWLLSAVIVLFIGTSLFFNINKTYQNKSSIIPIVETPIKVNQPVETTVNTAIAAQNPVETKNENKIAAEKNTPLPTKENKQSIDLSYIVIGAFFDESRANKLKTEAENKGYTVNISKDNNNGLYRATVQIDNNEVAATLEKVKSELNPRAWIYCIKCNL